MTRRRGGGGTTVGAAVGRDLFEEVRDALAAASDRPPETVSDDEVEACLRRVVAGEGGSLPERLDATLTTDPDAVAVVCAGRHLTRGGLRARALALALRLTEVLEETAAAAETPIAITVDPSVDQAVAVVGVLMAGAVAVPLDRTCPPGWRTAFARRAGARLQVGGGSTLDLPAIPVSGPGQPGVDDAGCAQRDRPAAPSPAHAALVVEASGEPLVLEHRAVIARIDRLLRFLDRVEAWEGGGRASGLSGHRVRVPDPLAVHGWPLDLLLPLVAGVRLEIGPRSAERTVGTGEETPPWRTPSLVDAPEAGGEVLLAGATTGRVGEARRCGPFEPAEAAVPYILDRRGQLVPVGVWGELHAAPADGVRGIAGAPAATAERFRPDPFGTRPGGRLTATGFRARLRPTGGYEIDPAWRGRGRRFHHRGRIVDLGRLERLLRTEIGVEARVVASGETDGLAAWVYPEKSQREGGTPGATWDLEALTGIEDRVADRLAPWERPDAIVPCDRTLRGWDGAVLREAAAEAQRLPLAVAATFTAGPLVDPLTFWIETLGWTPALRLAPYAQVIQEILRPDGVLARARGGWNVLLVRLEDWSRAVAETVNELLAALETRRRMAEEPDAVPRTLLVVCPSPDGLDPEGEAARTRLVDRLVVGTRTLPGVEVVDAGALAESYGVAEPDDHRSQELGHIPYTDELYAALAAVIARKLSASLASGPAAVAVGNLPDEVSGSADLAHFLEAQERLGRLLRSWNGAKGGVAAPAHPDAADRLRALAAETGVPVGRWAYLGTDPGEHSAIVDGCPEALAIRLPGDPERLATFLGHLWPFDSPPVVPARSRLPVES